MAALFSKYKGNLKKYEGKFDCIFIPSNYSLVSFHLLGQHFLSQDELKDTSLAPITQYESCMRMQFDHELHAHANFLCMQFYQDGCLSSLLDFRSAVLRDASSQLNRYRDLVKFSFVYFEISSVFRKFKDIKLKLWILLCHYMIPDFPDCL